MENKSHIPSKISRLVPPKPISKSTINILKAIPEPGTNLLIKENIPSKIGLKRRSKSFSEIRPTKTIELAKKACCTEFPNKAIDSLTFSRKPLNKGNAIISKPVINKKLDKIPESSTVTKSLLIKKTSVDKVPDKKPALNNKRPAPDNKTEAVKPKVARAAKPAAYDYKARYALENEKNVRYLEELKVLRKDVATLNTDCVTFKEERDELQVNYTKCRDILEKLQKETKEKTEQLEKDLLETKSKLDKVIKENEEYLKTIETTEAQLKLTEADKFRLEKLQQENDEINSKLLKDLTETRINLEKALSENADYKSQLKDSEDLRRTLHNAVQDLKGNIRVFCRVRPPKEDEDQMLCNMTFLDETSFEIKKMKESISCMNGKPTDLKLEFNFDRVFPPNSSQEEVFKDLAQLVQSALDGYNVCVFAYGQTGSGKTYTMQGNEANLGMIPRSVELLFQNISKLENIGWKYEVQVSFLEIYNETIRDLLDPNNTNTKEIRYNEGKGATVTNLRIETINSAAHLNKLMITAQRNRAVAATNFNEHSSRSHAVTKITLQGYNSESEDYFHGSINLVDLAGSESAKNSERITETKNINKSLSTLGNVMLALHNNETHVPYRNSKLTYLLQSCLGGNSKTLMFVNISPFEDCFAETVNSLRFAAKVKEVKTGSKRNKGIKQM